MLALGAIVAVAMVLAGGAWAATSPRLVAAAGGYVVWVDTDAPLDIVTIGVIATDPPACDDWAFQWNNLRLVSQGLQDVEFLQPGPQGTVGLAKIGSFAVPPSESGLDFFAIQATTVLGGLFGSRAGPLNAVGENSFQLGWLQTTCTAVLASSNDLLPAFGDMQVRVFQGAADRDVDGVADLEDNCLFRTNPGQADADQNTIGDACECGDVNGDGFANVTDALTIARGILSSTDPNFAKCDVNGDGVCNVTDALTIARGQVSASDQLNQLCPAAHELGP
jgi:hypothetical protein